jgi:orotate phosphoribosyltransferase
MTEYDRAIAGAALDIGAIKLWPKHGPFQWASGYTMPIYNDNRMLLANPDHRRLVAEALRAKISSTGVRPDMIAGTSTAGIAPAASLAQLMELPLAIQHQGEVYVFHQGMVDALSFESGLADGEELVVSTCPFAIIPAVMDANNADKSFAYVRQEQKDHGLQQQIEGIVREGQRAFLIDYHRGNGYADIAKAALEQKGVIVNSSFSEDISDILRPADVTGKTVVQVEDLISTGTSYLKEIEVLRNKGAVVACCAAIFSYLLPEALEKAEKAGVVILPALTYPVLLGEARSRGVVDKDSMAALNDWMQAPFEWGERHGFPPKKK